MRPHAPTVSLRLGLTATAIALLAGCSMAPRYERPQAPIAGSYIEAETAESGDGAVSAAGDRRASEIPWQQFFGDARLRGLIDVALDNNRDLRQAILNVEAARAQFRIQRADRLPTVNANAQGTRQRIPDGTASSTGATTGGGGIYEQYSVGLGVSAYELDLFGRVRSLRDAALAEYLATEQARRGAQISLIAAVATAYLNERAAAERMDIVLGTLDTRAESLRLAQLRFDAGVGSELELREAQTLHATARAQLAAAKREQAQARNSLTLLIGQPIPEDRLPPPLPLGQQALIADVPAGLPSELIERRPDILAAEQSLRAANASIGAARAAFFPRISLTGSYGTSSSEFDGLFDSGTESWSFMPQITLPIFDAGRNRANLDLAQLRENIAVAEYEKAIQTAFREVADGLAARSTLDEELAAQTDLLEATQRRMELSELRYRSGVDSSLQRLDAQRALFEAQQSMLQTRLLRLSSLVDLYRALGGGWRADEQAEEAGEVADPS